MQNYIYIALFVAVYVVFMHHDIQMFQLNSYRYSRYFRWWRSEAGGILDKLKMLLLLSPKAKTPLVYTSRVKRLFVIDTLLVAVAIGILIYCSIELWWLIAMLIGSPLIMLLSNVIATPIEKCITRWYINDARKIISSHKDLIIIGVTGSYGKTSTKNYLYRLLSEQYNVLVTPGNFNTLLGVVRTIREHLRPQHQIFIVEMGAKQRGDIKEICDLVHPSIAIVTAVGEAHLETFGSVENIQKTKFELVESLPSDGMAVINLDSESIANYNSIPNHCRVVSYSIDNIDSNYRAYSVGYNASGVAFTLDIDGAPTEFSSPLLGGGNVLNLTASIVVARELGVAPKLIQRAMKQLQPVEHRLSMKRSGGLVILDDAYNSNPAGAKMALSVLRDFTREDGAQRIVITPGFVEMGASQFEANRELGRDIAVSCDYAVVVNRVNREAICSGLKDANFGEDKLYVAENLSDARQHLATRLKVGDVVLYENDLPDTFK